VSTLEQSITQLQPNLNVGNLEADLLIALPSGALLTILRFVVSAAEKIKKCEDALFLTDIQDDRAELISVKGARVEHTCEWIEENEVYKSWLSEQRNLMWISGGPG
jgi:exoribonuclease II